MDRKTADSLKLSRRLVAAFALALVTATAGCGEALAMASAEVGAAAAEAGFAGPRGDHA